MPAFDLQEPYQQIILIGAVILALWFVVRSRYRDLLETILLALVIFMLVRSTVQNFRVEGHSMDPSLNDGQYLMVNKLIYTRVNTSFLSGILPFFDGDGDRFLFRPPARGDVIVFHPPTSPERDFIKRIIAEAGDVVEIRMGTVYVNGMELDEPYITHRSRDNLSPTEVPPGHYFVLGDNRTSSTDSRSFGPIPLESIVGMAWFTYWPPSDLGLAPNYPVAAKSP